eukprot:3315033-Prymnesium_polylepis.1
MNMWSHTIACAVWCIAALQDTAAPRQRPSQSHATSAFTSRHPALATAAHARKVTAPSQAQASAQSVQRATFGRTRAPTQP